MNPYPNITIYYFSGTGNSQNVSSWLSQIALEREMECQITNIAHIDRRHADRPELPSLIAFISPVHGFNFPPIMLHFIMRFPKGNNKVLLLNTRAGIRIGKFVVPGLTGIAFYLSALILTLKGYTIKAMYPVNLPSNWISVHPGLNDKTVKYLHEQNKMSVTAFANRVFSGKSDFRAVREIIQDIIVSPISVGYYFAGRFLFAKTYYASRDCDGCDRCIKECPVKAIKKIDQRPYWTFNCESCMRCMSNCPKKAIETAHGFIIGFILVFSLVLSALFYKYIKLPGFMIDNVVINSVAETVVFLSLLGISYRIMHFAMRLKFVERLMVYTSLTKFKFWGRRYKALKNF